MLQNSGGEFNGFHWSHLGYIPASEHAFKSIHRIIPVGAQVALIEPATLKMCGAVEASPLLTFGLETAVPVPPPHAEIAEINLKKHLEFLDSRCAPRGVRYFDDREKDHEIELTRIGCLLWLAAELKTPVSYFFHEGDNGLNYEYAWGAGGDRPMYYFNEYEIPPRNHPMNEPASALTACLWYVGVRVANICESDWTHKYRLVNRELVYWN